MGHKLRLAAAIQGNANAYYRAIVPLQELERRGHSVQWPEDPTLVAFRSGSKPAAWDALHVQNLFEEHAVGLMERLRRARVAVVWDTDDDFSSLTRGMEAWRRVGGRRNVMRKVKLAVQAAHTAHLVTTTNERLAQVYRDHGVEHVTVIDNYLPVQALGCPRRRHQGVVIGITAAQEHSLDLRNIGMRRVLERLLKRHDGVRVVAIGSNLGLHSHRYTRIDAVEIHELIRAESEFDIALAPLCDTAFNRARSNVKLKEYAAAGAMWLASPVGPYLGMGEEQGGLLVDDDQWQATLEALLADPDRRRALAARARAWAEGQTIRAGGARWQAAFRDAIQRARGG